MRILRTFLSGLFALPLCSLCAQQQGGWTPQDSLRLQQLLEAEGEPELNRDLLPVLEMDLYQASPKVSMEKEWMKFDSSSPLVVPKKSSVMTLHPYTANTPYNWDPIREKKIDVKPDTWRGEPFRELVTRFSYTNQPPVALPPRGHDLMLIFTRDFWDVKGRKRRERTREMLRIYGDSITVQERR